MPVASLAQTGLVSIRQHGFRLRVVCYGLPVFSQRASGSQPGFVTARPEGVSEQAATAATASAATASAATSSSCQRASQNPALHHKAQVPRQRALLPDRQHIPPGPRLLSHKEQAESPDEAALHRLPGQEEQVRQGQYCGRASQGATHPWHFSVMRKVILS